MEWIDCDLQEYINDHNVMLINRAQFVNELVVSGSTAIDSQSPTPASSVNESGRSISLNSVATDDSGVKSRETSKYSYDDAVR